MVDFMESRPTRDEFQSIHQSLQSEGGLWEAFWRAYLLLRVVQEDLFKFPTKGKTGEKFSRLKKIINNISGNTWKSESYQALLQLSTDIESKTYS